MKKTTVVLSLLLSLSAHAQFGKDCIGCGVKAASKVVSLPQVPGVNGPLLKIETPVLSRNNKAIYCKRDTNMIDTIVFHHSGSNPTQTIQNINAYHKSQGSADDPWLMIAYHYAITSPYAGSKIPTAKVEQGRPLDLVGSHAGTDTWATPTKEAAKVMKEKPPLCGNESTPFKPKDDLYNPKDGRSRANFSTMGVVIIGNYEPYSATNTTGYPKGKPIYPTEDLLETAGKLACEMQRQHPSIKFIKWHSFYKSTGCPGTVKERIQKIVDYARKYGCTF